MNNLFIINTYLDILAIIIKNKEDETKATGTLLPGI